VLLSDLGWMRDHLISSMSAKACCKADSACLALAIADCNLKLSFCGLFSSGLFWSSSESEPSISIRFSHHFPLFHSSKMVKP
jgi:hypothetical protein